MSNTSNDTSSTQAPSWIHPWDLAPQDFDSLDRDNRFFSIAMKGLLNWLDTNVMLYGKHIRHFIVQTGTEYLYQESNGYSFSWTETTGEDYIYMQKPRCVVEWESIEVLTEDIASPFARGLYERYSKDQNDNLEVRAYSAEVRILPLKLPIKLKYVLSKFNEQIIMAEELLNLFSFVRYFSVSYLGDQVEFSIEFPTSITHATNIKLDYNAERKDRIIELSLDVKCAFPIVMERTDIDASNVIKDFVVNTQFIRTEWPEPNIPGNPRQTPTQANSGASLPLAPSSSNEASDGSGGRPEVADRELAENAVNAWNKENRDPSTGEPANPDSLFNKEHIGKIIKLLEEGLVLRFSDHETEVIERILLDNDQIYINSTKK